MMGDSGEFAIINKLILLIYSDLVYIPPNSGTKSVENFLDIYAKT